MYYYIGNYGDFFISHIKEPGIKLYFCGFDNCCNTLKFTDNFDSCTRFKSRMVATALCEQLVRDFPDINLTIEKVGD